MEPIDKQDRYAIHSIEKALDVIEALSVRDFLSLGELADLVSQPKSSLYRIVLTLEKRGFLSRSEDGKYCMGLKQLVLTKNLLERNSLRNAAVAEMGKLAEKYGDTVNLCVLAGPEILYIEIIEGTYALRMSDSVGSKSPIHATAAGKAIAAFLPEMALLELLSAKGLPPLTTNTITEMPVFQRELHKIREKGFALDNEENTQGAKCVGVPVFNMFGRVEGAISISGAAHRFTKQQLPGISSEIKEVGQRISQKLGFFPDRPL